MKGKAKEKDGDDEEKPKAKAKEKDADDEEKPKAKAKAKEKDADDEEKPKGKKEKEGDGEEKEIKKVDLSMWRPVGKLMGTISEIDAGGSRRMVIRITQKQWVAPGQQGQGGGGAAAGNNISIDPATMQATLVVITKRGTGTDASPGAKAPASVASASKNLVPRIENARGACRGRCRWRRRGETTTLIDLHACSAVFSLIIGVWFRAARSPARRTPTPPRGSHRFALNVDRPTHRDFRSPLPTCTRSGVRKGVVPTCKKHGGGWAAIRYTLRMANRVGWWRLWKAMRSKTACKTCALGMGGQLGGMRNELGHWPEVCKKSLQAMVGDMQEGLRPEFFQRYRIADLQTLSSRELEWCGRLTRPLHAGPGDTHYRVIDWDEALTRVADQLRSVQPDQHFFYASGRSSNEAGFLLQLLARLYGTNFVHNCSYYCHQASSVGLGDSLGTGTATVSLDDVEKTDLFFLIGANPASNHPRLMRSLMNVRRRGGKVIVINPVKEVGLVNFHVPSDVRSMLFGSEIASLYVQPHIGGDQALLTGVAKVILERKAVVEEYVNLFTDNFDDYAAAVRETSWESIERGSGVERATIERIADIYAAAKSAIFGWCMGITHHEHGVGNVQSIINLALLRGMAGRPGAGLLPIRGHSNVQGVGSMGVMPDLKKQIFDNLEAYLKVSLPTSPGLDTLGCMQAAERGEVRSAFCLGGNLFGSSPDARAAGRAIAKLDQITYLNTTLNTGHAWGRAQHTLILPVLARDEEPEPTTQESMFNFVRMSDGGKARVEGPRSEVDLIASLAIGVLGPTSPVDWASMTRHCHVRQLIARIIPEYEPIGDMDRTKQEFVIKRRVIHQTNFRTHNGKAQFRVHPLPPPRPENELRLMTVRSEGQFNTVVYEEEDIYRGQERRDVILLNRADIDRLGLRVDQRVRVRSETGSLSVLVRAFDIRLGNALMYYPEANVLVPAHTDPRSKTPAFKAVPVTVEPDDGRGVQTVVMHETVKDVPGRVALDVVVEKSAAAHR